MNSGEKILLKSKQVGFNTFVSKLQFVGFVLKADGAKPFTVKHLKILLSIERIYSTSVD